MFSCGSHSNIKLMALKNYKKKLTDNLGIVASFVTIASAMAGAIIWMFSTFALQDAFSELECRSKAQAAFLTNSIIVMKVDSEISILLERETTAEVKANDSNTVEDRNALKAIQTELENKKNSRKSIVENTINPSTVDCTK